MSRSAQDRPVVDVTSIVLFGQTGIGKIYFTVSWLTRRNRPSFGRWPALAHSQSPP